MLLPFKRLALLIALALLTAACGLAQQDITHASVTGRVVDASGASLAHTAIAAREAHTGLLAQTTTDEQGRFRFPLLPAGLYSIRVEAAGFAPGERTLELNVGSAFDLTITMTPATVAATVQVSTAMQAIETDRSEIAGTVLQAEAEHLPFEGRNYLDLALLLPGVSVTNTGSTQTLAETSEIPGQGYTINGQRNFSNSLVVDGLSANDDAAGLAGNMLSLDAVQQFQVVTSGGQAEFGRALGGYFNVVTRSGANDPHATVYGLLRNQRMAAANPLSQTKLPLTQGQYGLSGSGPLRRDRSFLFANFEESRLNTAGVLTIRPSDAAAINTRLRAIGYTGPLLTVANGPAAQFPSTLHTDMVFARLDQHFSQNDTFNARYNLYTMSSRNARGTGGLNDVSNGTAVYDTHHTLALGNVAEISPTLFNETRAQLSYDDLSAPPNDVNGPAVTISGVATFGRSTSSPTERDDTMAEAVDNVVIQHGAHTWKAGLDALSHWDSITYPQSLRGSYSFACLYSVADAPAGQTGCSNNFFSGRYNTQGYTQNFGDPTVRQTNPNAGVYLQDEWKISRALTLNTGLRYELQWLHTIQTDTNNLSPRVGVAWSPFTSGRTVVRASYGIFYDRIPLRPLANALLSADNTTDPSHAQFISYSFSPADAGAPVFPAVANAPPLGANINYALMDRHIRNPSSQQVSAEMEQQVSNGGTFGISYQHVRGEHLVGVINTNINVNGTRPDPTRGNVKPYRSMFDSSYDGLSVSLLQRPAAWGSLRISYTWSKAIDDVGEFFFSAPINNFAPWLDRGRSDDDQRHRVVMNAVLHTPMRPGRSFAMRLWHEWQVSGILQYGSRLPFNIITGTTTKQATSQRPCMPGFNLSDNAGVNPCTEALPGTVIGRNTGVGFDRFGLDTRLSRTFGLYRSIHVEALAEAFNTLNHRNDMIPNATWGTGAFPYAPNSSFGKATGVGDPRNVQLGMRLTF